MKAHDILEHCTCCEESYTDEAYDELDRLESDFLELEAKCDAQAKEIEGLKTENKFLIDGIDKVNNVGVEFRTAVERIKGYIQTSDMRTPIATINCIDHICVEALKESSHG